MHHICFAFVSFFFSGATGAATDAANENSGNVLGGSG